MRYGRYTVHAFPIFSHDTNLIACRVIIRDAYGVPRVDMYTGPSLTMAWAAAECHIDAETAYLQAQEVAA